MDVLEGRLRIRLDIFNTTPEPEEAAAAVGRALTLRGFIPAYRLLNWQYPFRFPRAATDSRFDAITNRT